MEANVKYYVILGIIITVAANLIVGFLFQSGNAITFRFTLLTAIISFFGCAIMYKIDKLKK